MSSQQLLPIESLRDTYDIVAETRVRDGARTFMATRRDDGAAVLIALSTTPSGDEKHALTHLAADTNLLAHNAHRNLIRVLEGRWLGNDLYAVVTERIAAPSLEELLARGEQLSQPRIAAILQDVNGLLEWAREQGVVHRAVHPEALFVEPGTDRALVSFSVRPIPVTGAPGLEGDARTIALLARTMLAGVPLDSEDAQLPLSELRPDLPDRLIEESEFLLHVPPTAERAPDVRGYIALIAMTEALSVGEDELARVRAVVLQEQRTTREQLEKEREEFATAASEREKLLVEEREKLEQSFASRSEELERSFAERSEEIERSLTERTEKLEREIAKQREQLAEERSDVERTLAREREKLTHEREMLEQLKAEIADYRASAEQRLLELELRRNEIQQLTELGLERDVTTAALSGSSAAALAPDDAAIVSELEVPPDVDDDEIIDGQPEVLVEDTPALAEAVRPAELTSEPRPPAIVPVSPPPSGPSVTARRDANRNRRPLIIGALGLAVVAVATAFAIRSGDEDPASQPRTTLSSGAIGTKLPPPVSAVPLPATRLDSAASVTPAADSAPPAPRPRRRRAPVQAPPDTAATDTTAQPSVTPEPVFGPPLPSEIRVPRIDSLTRVTPVRPDTVVRRDTTIRRDTTVRPRPDSLARPDTTQVIPTPY